MERYIDPVKPALVPLTALGQQVLADMDDQVGGIRWWKQHLDEPRRILIGDYLATLMHSLEANLAEAVMHTERARELWYADGHAFRQHVRSGRAANGSPFPRGPREDNRGVEEDAHVGGFFRAVGSVMDNLAGLVIGVAGLSTDIVRADVSVLRLDKPTPKGLLPEDAGEGRDRQLELVEVIRVGLAEAPAGWWRWVDGMRNTLVHRARRLTWLIHDAGRDDSFFRPLPLNPDQTQGESLARAEQMKDQVLPEHALDTMSGSIKVAVSTVAATAAAAVQLWELRRSKPTLIVQPRTQWPKLARGASAGFIGFGSGVMPTIDQTQLWINPDFGVRMSAGRFLDVGNSAWDGWFAGEA